MVPNLNRFLSLHKEKFKNASGVIFNTIVFFLLRVSRAKFKKVLTFSRGMISSGMIVWTACISQRKEVDNYRKFVQLLVG